MKCPVVPISDVCQQIRGVSYKGGEALDAPKDGYLPILRANNISDGKVFYDDLVFVPQKYISKTQVLRKNDIVIAASSGSIEIVGKAAQIKDEFKGSFGAFCKVLRPNSDVDPRYLSYFFKTPFYRHTISHLAAGANINNLRNEHLDNLKIPFPPKPVQEKVTTVLEKAESALEKRRQTIRLADEFLKSAFLEMFGDPVRNPKKLNVVLCGEISSHVTSGSTPLGGNATYLEEGILFIRSQNVLMNRLDLSDVAYISNEVHHKMRRTWVKKDDILLNITGASIGRVAFYEGEDDLANVNQHVCIIRPVKTKVLPEYLSFLISMPNFQRTILGKNAGATRQAFNFDQIKRFQIPLALLSEQQKFVDLVQKVERLKEKQKQSETELTNLFNSLMQRAFKGESF